MNSTTMAERARARAPQQYHLVARWEVARTAWGRLVRAFTCNPIHVEWLLHAPNETCSQLCFSAFMGEGFAMTTITEGSAEAKEWIYTAMPVTQAEAERMLGYMMGMVASKVQYNYADLGVAAGLCGHGSFEETMFPDVRPEGPKDLDRVFCSQAMIIVMRSCLGQELDGSPSARAREIVDRMNSRTVAPSALYRALRGVMREIQGYPPNKDDPIQFCTEADVHAEEESRMAGPCGTASTV